MRSAAELVATAVRATGPLRFDEYMRMALYGEGGFYTSGGAAGRRGDFITSPEVGPLFGAVVANFVVAEWDRLGRPTGFMVVEVGAGPGTLARSVTRALAERSALIDYVAVELADLQRAAHPAGVASLPSMPPGPLHGVVLANELLDNLPFRLLVFDGGWREAFVDVVDDRFVEVLQHLADPPGWLPDRAPHGARIPWQHGATRWVGDAIGRLALGSLLVFDYVTARTADLAVAPWRSWLRTYRQHLPGTHYLDHPGSQDITAQVALDQLPTPSEAATQREFLRRWGIDALVDEGRRTWTAHAAAPTVAALAMRSRIREADALLDPSGLGGFQALCWSSVALGEVA